MRKDATRHICIQRTRPARHEQAEALPFLFVAFTPRRDVLRARRMRAAFKWGPYAAVRWGRQARRGIDRTSIPFCQDRSPVEKPGFIPTGVLGSRTCGAWMPGKRQAGWPYLWVTFLLATQEKGDSVAEGDRKLLSPSHLNATFRTNWLPAEPLTQTGSDEIRTYR